MVAKYDYTAAGPQELDLKKNERLVLLDDSMHWWKVLNSKQQSGFVPSNFVKKEKPSIFDSIRKKVKKRSESKKSSNNNANHASNNSPLSSPVAVRTVDINISGKHTAMASGWIEFDHVMFFCCSDAEKNKDESALNSSNGISSHNNATTTTMNGPKSVAIVKYNYEAQQADELALTKESRITVLEKSSDGWWKGQMEDRIGWFPSNYVIEQPIDAVLNGSPAHQRHIAPHSTASLITTASGNGSFGRQTNALEANLVPSNAVNAQQPVLDLVVALYSFTSQNEEELSFEKGERLDIVDKPANDPDWWMARNKQAESGLVPKNYVRVLSGNERPAGPMKGNSNGTNNLPTTGDKNSAIKNQIWYYGAISRGQCDQLLNEFAENGDFLIRDSETNVSFALSIGFFSFCLINFWFYYFTIKLGRRFFRLLEGSSQKQAFPSSFRRWRLLHWAAKVWFVGRTDRALQEGAHLHKSDWRENVFDQSVPEAVEKLTNDMQTRFFVF